MTPARPTPAVLLLYWGGVAAVWLVLLAGYLPAVVATAARPDVRPAEVVALAGIGLASSVIWFVGIRHLAMWLVSSAAPVRLPRAAPAASRVVMLYCTADDLNAEALLQSADQDHPVEVVILDDSVRGESRAAVDALAQRTGFRVLRRPHRTGHKAGNLNHGLARLRGRFDHVVVLDSDEIVPSHFVSRALADFAADPRIGVVQGRHRAVPRETAFTAAFAGLLESHVTIVQRARSRMGFSAFMGRGGMISAACLEATGPLPEVVTEDVAFSLEVRRAGFVVHYDDALVSVEDYPVDYRAFRTQHAKTVEGTVEFLRGSWRRILGSRMGRAEKLDLLVEQLAMPAVGAASVLLLVGGLVLAAHDGSTAQPLWAMGVTGLLGIAALLPETVRRLRDGGLLAGASFLAAAMALYASTLVVTLAAAARVVGGRRAVFAITPKRSGGEGLRGSLSLLRLDLGAAVVFLAVALLVTGQPAPALPMIGSVAAALAFAVVGSRPLAPRLRGRLTPSSRAAS